MAHPDAHSITIQFPSGQKQQSTVYTFQNIGDEIPAHTHTFFHSALCIKGICEVFNSEGKSVKLDGGCYAEFPAGKEHGLRALTPGMILINTNEPQ